MSIIWYHSSWLSRGENELADTGKRDYRHRSLDAVLAGGKWG
jgi:hypothetical protein